MNTTELTIEEILAIYHRKRGLPKGTTEQQWRDYHNDMLRHEAYYNERRPNLMEIKLPDTMKAVVEKFLEETK